MNKLMKNEKFFIVMVSLIYTFVLFAHTALLTFFFYDVIVDNTPLVRALMFLVMILSWLMTHQIQRGFEQSLDLVNTLFLALLVTNTVHGILDIFDNTFSPAHLGLLTFIWVALFLERG